MKLNFYIQNEKVFDNKGIEIPEDENGIVKVDIEGEIRRFIRTKLIKWLEVNPDIRQAKISKANPIPSQYEAKYPTVKPPRKNAAKPKKEKPIRIQKQPKLNAKKEKPEKLPRTPKPPKVKAKKQMGRKQIYPRDESGRRIDKIPKGYSNHTHGGDYGYPRRAVVCTTNGKEYNSLYQAAKELGLSRAYIWNIINGKYRSKNGVKFKYSDNANSKSNL